MTIESIVIFPTLTVIENRENLFDRFSDAIFLRRQSTARSDVDW